MNKVRLGPSSEDRKSQFCHAAAKKCLAQEISSYALVYDIDADDDALVFVNYDEDDALVQCDAWSIKMMIRVFSSFVVLVVDRTFSHILIICGELLFCFASTIQEISGPVSIYLGLKNVYFRKK